MNGFNLKLAIRNIMRNNLSSAISITGLSVGFAAFILITFFIRYEYSWDKHNSNYDRIYRVQRRITADSDVSPSANPILKNLLTSRYPEIDKLTLLYLSSDEDKTIGEFLSTKEDMSFQEFDGIYAEQNYLDIFTLQLTEGKKENALSEPFTILLSSTLAQKLFPEGNALGGSVILNKKFNLKVTGVYNELPINSHIRPSYIISLTSIAQTKGVTNYETSWRGDFYIYLTLKPGQEHQVLNSKIKNITTEFQENNKARIYLQPLSELYVQPNEASTGYKVALNIFTVMAILILLLVSFNYINLNTANSILRAKEIAVQKVNGSGRMRIIYQFLSESALIAFISFLIALIIAELSLPGFNSILESQMVFDYLKDWQFFTANLLLAILVGILSGIYPALVMSRYKAVDLFRQFGFSGNADGQMVKQVLVGLQFVICIALLALSINLSRQIDYMMKKDLGFDKDNFLVTKLFVSRTNNDFQYLKTKLLSHPEITDVCYADKFPFGGNSGWPKNWEGGPTDEKENDNFYWVSSEFIKTMKMEMVYGRDFGAQFTADSGKAVIINETAARRFGWNAPIGKKIDDGRWTVVDVVKDFHPYAVFNRVRNCIFTLDPTPLAGAQAFGFRIAPGTMETAKQIINSEMEAYFPNDAFEVISYADFIDNDPGYRKFKSVNRTIIMFAILNIMLAVMGLLGLVAFTSQQKSKEIAIRKINGCSVGNILLILNRQFIWSIVVASAIAWPAAWFVSQMLPIYYRLPEKLSIYLGASVLLIAISFASSLFYTWKAATRNPVEALRYE